MKHASKLLLVICAGLLLLTRARADAVFQAQVSPTPINISIPTAIPFAVETQAGPAAPTMTRTPTQVGPAMLQAITEANVRAQPDPEAERLGTIRAGDLYPVIGRYFRWLQFQYDQSSSGTGWVFDELVEIVGDASVIRDLSVEAAPTTDPVILEQTQTAEAITLVPGGQLTATAAARVISIPAPPLPGMGGDTGNVAGGLANPEATVDGFGLPTGPTLLPTFTFPPNLVAATPTDVLAVAVAATPTVVLDPALLPNLTTVPPVVPILLLGAFGVLGLAVSSFRR